MPNWTVAASNTSYSVECKLEEEEQEQDISNSESDGENYVEKNKDNNEQTTSNEDKIRKSWLHHIKMKNCTTPTTSGITNSSKRRPQCQGLPRYSYFR